MSNSLPDRPVLRRIALFLHALEEGGAQRRTLTLAERLIERGIDVDLLVVDERGPLRDLLPGGVRLKVLGQPLAWLPWIRSHRGRQLRASVPALTSYLRREHPDVLVSAANHTALATVRAHRWAKLDDTALVLRVSNALISRKRKNQWLRRQGMRSALRHVDAVATVSQALAAEVEQLISSPAPVIRTVVNPVVDPLRVEQSRRLAPAWEDDGREVILGVGRLVVQKDFATLIRAFAKLLEADRYRLVILGEGPERASLQALAQSLNVADRVWLPGRVGNPLPSFHAARLFVLSSKWEGMPGTLIEAMACGCAVLSTDCAGAREVLQDGRLGSLVPVADSQALADAMSNALKQPADRSALVQRALDFSYEPATDDFVSVLELARQRRLQKRTP